MTLSWLLYYISCSAYTKTFGVMMSDLSAGGNPRKLDKLGYHMVVKREFSEVVVEV